jgi:DnaJ-class molecular chaperone
MLTKRPVQMTYNLALRLQSAAWSSKAKGSDLDAEDAEIEVPDRIYFVTTSCATCGEQFYVMTLEAHWMAEYTCPDCKDPGSAHKDRCRVV